MVRVRLTGQFLLVCFVLAIVSLRLQLRRAHRKGRRSVTSVKGLVRSLLRRYLWKEPVIVQ